MSTRSAGERCALVVISDGFEEVETVTILTAMRQAGLCVKTVGLTSSPVHGAHGVCLVADMTLADLNSRVGAIDALILPQGKQSLARLETDPRAHRLLRQVVDRGGRIATGIDGLRLVRMAGARGGEVCGEGCGQVLLRAPGQSAEAFAQELIRALK